LTIVVNAGAPYLNDERHVSHFFHPLAVLNDHDQVLGRCISWLLIGGALSPIKAGLFTQIKFHWQEMVN
jgi:hypothetical protein